MLLCEAVFVISHHAGGEEITWRTKTEYSAAGAVMLDLLDVARIQLTERHGVVRHARVRAVPGPPLADPLLAQTADWLASAPHQGQLTKLIRDRSDRLDDYLRQRVTGARLDRDALRGRLLAVLDGRTVALRHDKALLALLHNAQMFSPTVRPDRVRRARKQLRRVASDGWSEEPLEAAYRDLLGDVLVSVDWLLTPSAIMP